MSFGSSVTSYKGHTNSYPFYGLIVIPTVAEKMTCALKCHLDRCEAFVVQEDVDSLMCNYLQPNSNPYGDLYISSDIGMCHFLPAGSPSDVYTITTSDLATTDVFCDMDTLGGGWTVIQNRFDGSQDFYKTWEEYKRGFGSPYGEYWIGNDNLYKLTSSGSYELRIEMENSAGVSKYATYSTFSVSSENENYTLTISGFTGSTYNGLEIHNNKPFSTRDRDDDDLDINCAIINQGGWWYMHCHRSNLNGPYRPSSAQDSKAMSWLDFESGQGFAALKSSTMLIRRTDI
ncbi:ficolin-2-like [Pecten maximus]|uniref:ficolin-2-like n=1 Tax=Pecten maximus TaxID=6579 RepID=UPI0014585D7B|nr:ficolin-2-like [Pecten maximus]